ncbi:hypothetical protein AAFF_G00416070 [Aldrovandia affinis]|uniref:Uncharacterized protein n=1 Tax=Aldrovandia affinis TaxID=143900 RepID=A0AAD7R3D4_9TELE|nr:hypothetical protein AAFF_G00416070 [Aldrovandia affinis]
MAQCCLRISTNEKHVLIILASNEKGCVCWSSKCSSKYIGDLGIGLELADSQSHQRGNQQQVRPAAAA